MIEVKTSGLRPTLLGLVAVALCLVGAPAAMAQGPDVIVGGLPSTNSYGTSGGTGIYAYSVATTSCNVGSSNLSWVASTNAHPVIAQDMWRLKDGRFTQIGNSWLKHGFCALQQNLCGACPGGGGCPSFLQPGCSDPYSASLNGQQGNLGPRSQVNAFTGVFPYPPGGGLFGGVIDRRLEPLLIGREPPGKWRNERRARLGQTSVGREVLGARRSPQGQRHDAGRGREGPCSCVW